MKRFFALSAVVASALALMAPILRTIHKRESHAR
jgi:hypothetical protein